MTCAAASNIFRRAGMPGTIGHQFMQAMTMLGAGLEALAWDVS